MSSSLFKPSPFVKLLHTFVGIVCAVACIAPSVYLGMPPTQAYAIDYNNLFMYGSSSTINYSSSTDTSITYGSSTSSTDESGPVSDAMNGALGSIIGGVAGMAVCYWGGYIASFLSSFFPWLSSPVNATVVAAVDIPLTAFAVTLGVGAGAAAPVAAAAAALVTVPTTDVVGTSYLGIQAEQNAAVAANTLTTAQSTTQTAAESSNNTFKECTLDGLMKMLANMIIDAVTDSIVAWIKGGFYGAPSFVEDPGKFFMDVAEYSVSAFLYESGLNEILCEPFRLDIILGISWNFYMPDLDPQYGQLSCSLDEFFPGVDINIDLNGDGSYGSGETMQGYSGNEAYAAVVEDGNIDFPGGGFPAVAAVLRNENNAFGSQIKATEATGKFVSQQVGRESTLLGYGKGWFSPRCNADKVASTPETVCTPGEYVAEQVNDWSGGQLAELELADEFAEIVNALLELLVEKVLSEGNSLLQYNR